MSYVWKVTAKSVNGNIVIATSARLDGTFHARLTVPSHRPTGSVTNGNVVVEFCDSKIRSSDGDDGPERWGPKILRRAFDARYNRTHHRVRVQRSNQVITVRHPDRHIQTCEWSIADERFRKPAQQRRIGHPACGVACGVTDEGEENCAIVRGTKSGAGNCKERRIPDPLHQRRSGDVVGQPIRGIIPHLKDCTTLSQCDSHIDASFLRAYASSH